MILQREWSDLIAAMFSANPFHLINKLQEHISQGSPVEAVALYGRARRAGTNVVSLIPLVLKACASIPSLRAGRALHCESVKLGSSSDLMVGTSLLRMYARSGDMQSSAKVFDEMHERSVATWNAMIGGFMRNGDAESARVLFEKMDRRSSVTWVEMIDGLAKMGLTDNAREIFDRVPEDSKNVKTWTAIVDGYARNGEMKAAREVFETMPERNCFVWSAMISGYCKSGNVEDARHVFGQVPRRSLEIWNTLISGYARNGFCEEAIEAFSRMQDDGFEPDQITLSSVLSACAQLGRLDIGKNIHRAMKRRGMKPNRFVSNALLDMYAKCGDLASARSIFNQTEPKNAACFNSMISGLAIHGRNREALDVFGAMESMNITPDEITFLSILSACAHGGFAGEGLETFRKMERHGLRPSVKHYGCLVDLLGRSGRLSEAYEVAANMPMRPNSTVLGALVGACKVQIRPDVAEKVAGCCAGDESYFVLVSSMFAGMCRWEEAEKMRMDMARKGLRKTPGCSSVML